MVYFVDGSDEFLQVLPRSEQQTRILLELFKKLLTQNWNKLIKLKSIIEMKFEEQQKQILKSTSGFKLIDSTLTQVILIGTEKVLLNFDCFLRTSINRIR